MNIKSCIFTAIILLSLHSNSMGQNSDIKSDVNWKSISTTPEVEETEVDLNKKIKVEKNKDTALDSLEFDFFNKANADERIFYNFKAKLKILNKNTDELKIVEIHSELPVIEKGYAISVKSCAKVEVYNAMNDFAYITISKKDKSYFKGWVSNINKSFNYPELRDLYITLDSCVKFQETAQSEDLNNIK